MQNLRLTTIQTDLHWENISANLEMFDEKVKALKGTTDVIVLPEMFTTGFSMNAKKMAESMDGHAVQWMLKTSNDLNAVVLGSIIIVEDEKYYNRMVVAFPDGNYKVYDKRHLFTLAGEHETFTAGKELLIFEWKGWKICPLICYDLRFPVWSRNTDLYDLLIYVANWPDPRRQAWKTLLSARAIENQSYTVGVNRIGKDGTGLSYAGDTSVIDYNGNVLYRSSDTEGIFTIELFYDKQMDFRKKLQFLPDRDVFEIKK